MKRCSVVAVLVALVAQLFMGRVGPVVTAQAAGSGDVVADELVVGIKPEALGQAADIHNKSGGRVYQQLAKRPVQVVKVDPAKAATIKAAYQRDPRVRFVEPNARVHAKALPNDPNLVDQWHLATIGATDAWGTATGQDVLVAVVDTGVDASHPDLRGQI